MNNMVLEEYLKATEEATQNTTSQKERIVLLLAAGFSIDAGYPTGSVVNSRLCSFTKEDFVMASNGELLDNRIKSFIPSKVNDYNIFEKAYLFLIDVIKLYTSNKDNAFNYEEFYDAIEVEHKKNNPLVFDIWSDEYRDLAKGYTQNISYERLVSNLPMVYDQLITFAIKGNMNSVFYEDVSKDISCYPKYINFLNYLIEKSKTSILDVFTTNHDLLFESFRNCIELNGIISDGFDDFGSEYFGIVRNDDFEYRCRLERYTGKYDTPIRLYKLHGSLDYVLYHKGGKRKVTIDGNRIELPFAIPSKYVKIKQGISPGEIYKSKRCRRKYDCSSTEIRSDFLSGVQTKISKYNNPFLYSKLFGRFKRCLKAADKMIVIGYGCNDSKINEIILNNFNYADKKVYMIDPYADKLAEKLKAIPIKKCMNDGILDCYNV